MADKIGVFLKDLFIVCISFYVYFCVSECMYVHHCVQRLRRLKELVSSPGTGCTGVRSCRAVPRTEVGFSEPSLLFQVAVLCVILG